MRYSLFAGGKRLRPILCLAGAAAVGGDEEPVIPAACALELIHTYSLIHDDLPAMDNDDLRRGKPTNHKVYGEAMALLAGDALLTEAFHLMTFFEPRDERGATLLIQVMQAIAYAAGYAGMVGGQTVDLQAEGKEADLPVVEFIHTHKTGALITVSVTSGALLSHGDEFQMKAIESYGRKIVLAFQISDDLLDIEGDTELLGKRTGSDLEKRKSTYPGAVGMAESKVIQGRLVNEAVASLSSFGEDAEPLRAIAQYIIERTK
jgi:geranylgeranyl diphosphate synthase type II